MAITFVSGSNLAAGSTNGDTFTTAAVVTTGASLIVVAIADYQLGPGVTISDSAANSWSARTLYATSNIGQVRTYYVASPSTSGTHTFTVTGIGTFASIAVAAFAGSHATPYTAETGANNGAGATTCSPGSVTPADNDSLVVTATVMDQIGAVATVPSGYTLTGQEPRVSGQHFGIALAYVIQTTAAATNPQWSYDSSIVAAANTAVFKAAAGGGAVSSPQVQRLRQFRNRALTRM